MESWAVRPFKFQWKNVIDEKLGPVFASLSAQRKSKFGKQRNKNIVIFAILGSLFNNSRLDVIFLVRMQLKRKMNIIKVK